MIFRLYTIFILIIFSSFGNSLFSQNKNISDKTYVISELSNNLFDNKERIISAEKEFEQIVIEIEYKDPTPHGKQEISRQLGTQFYLEFYINNDTLYSQKGIPQKETTIPGPSRSPDFCEWINRIDFKIKIIGKPGCRIRYKIVKTASKRGVSNINCDNISAASPGSFTFAANISLSCYGRVFKNEAKLFDNEKIDSRTIFSQMDLPRIFGLNIFDLEDNKIHTLKTSEAIPISLPLKKKAFFRYPLKVFNWMPASVYSGQMLYKSFSNDFAINENDKSKVFGAAFLLSSLPIYRIIEALALTASNDRSVNDPWLDDRIDFYFNFLALSIIAADYIENGDFDWFGNIKKLPPVIKAPPPLPNPAFTLSIGFNF